jgi:hypothetical protein
MQNSPRGVIYAAFKALNSDQPSALKFIIQDNEKAECGGSTSP